MNEFLKNIKGLKIGKRNTVLVVLAAAVLVLLLLSESLADSQKQTALKSDTEAYAQQYIESTQKELETLLESINGAGRVRVMLTLENCYENVYAKAYNQSESNQSDMQKSENTEEYVIIKNGSNTEESLLIKVYEPKIKGVAVVAQGAGNATVKKAITQTVCALFNISSTRVSVEKMANE